MQDFAVISDLYSYLANITTDDIEVQSHGLRGLSELNSVVADFKNHYELFGKKNGGFVRIDDIIYPALEKAAKDPRREALGPNFWQ